MYIALSKVVDPFHCWNRSEASPFIQIYTTPDTQFMSMNGTCCSKPIAIARIRFQLHSQHPTSRCNYDRLKEKWICKCVTTMFTLKAAINWTSIKSNFSAREREKKKEKNIGSKHSCRCNWTLSHKTLSILKLIYGAPGNLDAFRGEQLYYSFFDIAIVLFENVL